jgi:hypothetical protein
MRLSTRIASAAAALLIVAAGLIAAPAPAAQALSGADFDPSLIISDPVFFNSSSMTRDQIQSFLDDKGGTCQSGYTCLADYRQTTFTREADSTCQRYEGASNETAASIIVKVARACGINPQVLLVTLQKEQSLITSTAPSSTKYRIAMGYGCPDTAPCDTRYYGFYNQVYMAGRQLVRYGDLPSIFNWFPVGSPSNVRYHPNAACGSKRITIRSEATAALYYYTPYTPNAAALANLTGTGNSCSSYGNRNFWRFFNAWFGSPVRATQLASAPGTATASVTPQARVTLSWSAPTALEQLPVTDYRLTLSRDGGATWSLFSDPVSSSTTHTFAARPATDYIFRIQAVNHVGTGAASEVAFSTPVVVPAAPASLTAEVAGTTGLTLSWAAPESVGGGAVTDYQLSFSRDGGQSFSTFADPVGTATTARLTVRAGTDYVWRVRAVNSFGAGEPAEVAVSMPSQTPSAVQNLTHSLVGTRLTLDWDAPASPGAAAITDYRLSFSRDGGATFSPFTDPVSTATAATFSVRAGTDYQWRVTPVNRFGSGPGATIAVSTRATPDAVTSLAASVAPGPVLTLSWVAPARVGTSPIRDYRLTFSRDGGATYSVYPDAVSTATSATFPVRAGTDYRWRVQAVNAAGASPAAEVLIVTPAAAPPGAVTDLSAALSGRSTLTLSWRAPESAGGAAITDYRLSFSRDGGASYATYADGVSTATSATFPVRTATDYLWRVQAVNRFGAGPAASVAISTPV